MPVDEAVFRQLTEMGIEAPLARAAAERYSSVEPAINWVYSDDGMRWTPDTHLEVKTPDYLTDQGANASRVEVTPVAQPPAPRLPPRPNPSDNTQFASNNPFASRPLVPSPLSDVLSPAPTVINDPDDEDEDLRRALEISRGDMVLDGQEDDKRQERERSVRDGGPPPPSPIEESGDKDGVLGLTPGGVAFGPSNKIETGASMMVPSTQPSSKNTEDDDLNRALQESLMTASFHSAAAAKEEPEVTAKPRLEGTPLVYYSASGKNTYSSLFLQAILAVPQIQEAIRLAVMADQDSGMKPEEVDGSFNAFLRAANECTDDFIPVDNVIKSVRGTEERFQYPPVSPTMELHETLIPLLSNTFSTAAVSDRTGKIDDLASGTSLKPGLDISSLLEQPDLLFKSHLAPMSDYPATYVRVQRTASVPYDLYSSLASILWKPDAPTQSIVQLSEVLTVFVGWDYGAPRELFRLDEQIVLDRFMQENARHSALIRAQQSTQAGEARRLRETIDGLTTHDGHNLLDSIAALIKHHETSPESQDPIQRASRQEMKEKLQKTLDTLKAKTAALKEELEEKEAAASGKVFETDDPNLNRHVYDLRAVLMHDGMQVPGRHLYGYVKIGNQWWKIQEHEATKSDWTQIASDKTGLFMDGGAYCMVYSRNGPRPRPPSPISTEVTPSPTEGAAEMLIDLSSSTEDVPSTVQEVSSTLEEKTGPEVVLDEKKPGQSEIEDIIMS